MKLSGNYKLRNPKSKIKRYVLNEFRKQIYSMLLEFTDIESYLFVGCGEGFELKYFNKYNADKNILCVDQSASALNIAKKEYPNLAFKQGNIYNLNYGNYDCVVCVEVLEHLNNVPRALEQLKLSSKKYVLISVPNQPLFRIINLLQFKYLKNFGEYPDHKHSWTRKEFEMLLKIYFDIIKIKRSFFWNIFLCKNKTC